jgi:P-type Ca2+ transporter type 2C
LLWPVKVPTSLARTAIEKDLVFFGLVAFADPPREEVKEALRSCRTAGVEVKMITGDNKETAVEIAKQIGLGTLTLTGAEIDELTDKELSAKIKKVNVFARVRPEHKMRIVAALKQAGEIVAMTGDGVNDAPAIKEAHVGIAMGKNGTDVSRETADLIIKDDNFATIVTAIKEGRTIFNNIQKFITFQLSSNVSELFIMFFGVVLGLPYPLLPLQILFKNLVTDNMPAITLGFNPPSLDIMEMKARKKSNLLNKELLIQLAVAALTMGIVSLSVFYISYVYYQLDIDTSRTMTMITLILIQIINAYNFRSFRYPMHKLPFNTNPYLIYASLASIAATIAIVYLPINQIFSVVPIEFSGWVFTLFASFSIVVVMDTVKRINSEAITVAINRKKPVEF